MEIGFKSMGEGVSWNPAVMGFLPDKTCYKNAFMNIDMKSQMFDTARQFMPELKAMDTTIGGAGTAGNATIPVYLDSQVTDNSRKESPLTEIVPRVAVNSTISDWLNITAKGSATFGSEKAALSEQDETISRSSVTIKFLRGIGNVTGVARAAMPAYTLSGFQPSGSSFASPFSNAGAPNAKSLSMLIRARAMKEAEEDAILNGSKSDDANEFDGIVTTQSTTNKNTISRALEAGDIESTLLYAIDDGGRPDLGIGDTATIGQLRNIMLNGWNYRPGDITTQIGFGIPSAVTLFTQAGAIPVIGSRFLTTTSGSRSLYFTQIANNIEMRVLQDMTYEELAKTSDSEKFMLKIYEALVLKNSSFNCWAGSIS